MFSFLGRFFDWLGMICKVGRIKIKYDVAINDLVRRRKQISQAVTKNFETMYSLSDSIDNARLRLESNQKAANGAVDFYSDDPNNNLAPRHRAAGVAAISKGMELEKKILEWTQTRDALHQNQVALQQADIEIEERLSFLRLERPRAIAALKAVYHETSVWKRENGLELDPWADRDLGLLRDYQRQHKSIRAKQEFMKVDPLDVYRNRADGFNSASASQRFDEAVHQKERKVVDLVVRHPE